MPKKKTTRRRTGGSLLKRMQKGKPPCFLKALFFPQFQTWCYSCGGWFKGQGKGKPSICLGVDPKTHVEGRNGPHHSLTQNGGLPFEGHISNNKKHKLNKRHLPCASQSRQLLMAMQSGLSCACCSTVRQPQSCSAVTGNPFLSRDIKQNQSTSGISFGDSCPPRVRWFQLLTFHREP